MRFGGEELLGAKTDQLRALRGGRISMIFQEPMTSLNPLHSIEKQISETLILHRELDKAQARARTVELLEQVGLPNVEERLDAWPHQLSGGQRQRIAIGRALATKPEFIVADEPVSALDVTIQAQILDLLEDLKDEYGLTMLFVSHDLAVIRQIADRVAVLYRGKLEEVGNTSNVFNSPQSDYTQRLLAAIPGKSAA